MELLNANAVSHRRKRSMSKAAGVQVFSPRSPMTTGPAHQDQLRLGRLELAEAILGGGRPPCMVNASSRLTAAEDAQCRLRDCTWVARRGDGPLAVLVSAVDVITASRARGTITMGTVQLPANPNPNPLVSTSSDDRDTSGNHPLPMASVVPARKYSRELDAWTPKNATGMQ